MSEAATGPHPERQSRVSRLAGYGVYVLGWHGALSPGCHGPAVASRPAICLNSEALGEAEARWIRMRTFALVEAAYQAAETHCSVRPEFS